MNRVCYKNLTMSPRFFRTGLLLICAVVTPAAMARRALQGQPAATTSDVSGAASPVTLLVFPFENDGRVASLDWLGEGLAELTTERLQNHGVNLLARQDRLAALEKIGLPDSARFSHATLVKIATEA